ncbi:MAG: hypothetical protein JXB48_07480, partial [Candidatus Latescibacteria bacterium]|nr:hypothetical protein [Candidatus Latescibacterota bacterium]
MQKRVTVSLVIGILCLISGIVMIKFHVVHEIIPTIMISIGFVSVIVYIYTKGGTIILDEMMKRVDALSGYYSFNASTYFIITLSIINFFYPLPLSIPGLLMTMVFFNGISF